MSKIADAEANATSLDGLVNDNALVPTLRNGPKPSYQYLVDGWNAEIAATILEMNKSRGFRVVGTFAEGFTYELFNDVGVDVSGDSWIYVGAGAPSKVVSAGTEPSSPDYEKVTFNSAENIFNSDGISVDDFMSGADKLRNIISDGVVYPENLNETVSSGGIVPSGYTHLNTSNGLVRMAPVASGNIASMTSTRATIGGVLVNLFPYDLPVSQPDAVAVYNAKMQARLQRSINNETGGSLSILGDSITVGEGATSLEKSYASLVQNSIANAQTGGYGQDNETNFNWSSMGNVAISGQTAGVSGPIQRSQIISVGGSITVARANASRIAFFYDRTTTSGSVEVRQNGALLSTIDCSGADSKGVLSSYVAIAEGGAAVQFKVIDSPVEFLAIVPIGDNVTRPNVMMNMRMAVSGFNTEDFLESPDQLLSIGTVGAVAGADSIFVLAIGTNDIYTAARTPYEYTDNLRTIGTTLESYRPKNTIVLVVPPKANETLFPVAINGLTHADYKQAIYQLAVAQKWAVIDHSNLELSEQSMLVDGLHPDDRGHQLMAVNTLKSFGLSSTQSLTGVQRDALDDVIVDVNETIDDALESVSDVKMYRRSADFTTFTGTTTREKTLTSMGVTSSDFVNNVYIRWKSTGVMIPYQDCQDLQNDVGLQMLRSFSGAEYSVAKLFYKSPLNDGTGFAAPQGSLSGNITNTIAGYNDAEIVVEFTRSSKIDLA